MESVRIKRVEFRENVRAFFPQGQSKLSVIMRCPYKAGVNKVGFDRNKNNLIIKGKKLML